MRDYYAILDMFFYFGVTNDSVELPTLVFLVAAIFSLFGIL